jgi:hypothetical protein
MRTRIRNRGLRKRCRCKRRDWPKCPHGWHMNFKLKGGPAYRLSLDKEIGRHVDSKTEAVAEAERIRTAIRNGWFRQAPIEGPIAVAMPPFRVFADTWREQYGKRLASARDDVYRLATICAFVLPGSEAVLKFGDKPLDAVTTNDIEAFRDARKAGQSDPYTV